MSQEWLAALSQHQARITQLLKSQIENLPALAPVLRDAMGYALLMGGKRVRPAMLYTTGQMLGVKLEDLDAAAMALECIHCYSLVHDDLPAMDDDDLRRGQPTCHIAFDEASAILAGDALQTLAFSLLCDYPISAECEPQRVKLVSVLASASGYLGMCGGQALDMAATDKLIDIQQLEQLHQCKTGALLQASVKMACILADIPVSEQQQLAIFAEKIGLAFQVQDDILDVTGDTQTLGKPQGSDQSLNKSTYPALLGLDGAKALAQQLYQQALQALQPLPYNTDLLRSFAGYIVDRNH
ncbi:(2E,6E)-farnesyl diphosphate synthase [Bowmanella yangjiangensis]|uniref:(2E,6E)-farnesyl diphosphate synthase n=1 Tax=Bowmanella yangjiangensis TaxID=2811230 RepID=A0ABS3CPB2_9ALTE|nr:(2E,6E)-farnesyl diphosphate synthase [Bowmanella yangjiangensis]MBN7818931.1 (2E,6E)-farnesyl diphosphate synthase [Bowmanella yangjiangensis]